MKTIELKWIEDDNHVVAEDAYNGLKDLIDSGVFPNLTAKCEDDTLYITGEKEDLDKAVMKIQKAYAKYGQIMIKEAKNGVSQELRIESFDENVQDIFNHTLNEYNKFKSSKERPLNYVKQLNDYRFKFKKFYETAARSDKKLLKPYLDEISNLLDESEIVNKIKPIKKINEGKLIDADALNVMMELIDLGYPSEAASRLIKKYTNFINKELKDGAKPYWIAKLIEDDMVNQKYSDKDNEEELVKEAKEICKAAGKKLLKPYLDEISNLDESEFMPRIKPIKKINEDSLDDFDDREINARIAAQSAKVKKFVEEQQNLIYNYVKNKWISLCEKYKIDRDTYYEVTCDTSFGNGLEPGSTFFMEIKIDYLKQFLNAIKARDKEEAEKWLFTKFCSDDCPFKISPAWKPEVYNSGDYKYKIRMGFIIPEFPKKPRKPRKPRDPNKGYKKPDYVNPDMKGGTYFDGDTQVYEMPEENEAFMIKTAKDICEAAGKKVLNPEQNGFYDVLHELIGLGYNRIQAQDLIQKNVEYVYLELEKGHKPSDIASVIDNEYVVENADNELTKHLGNLKNWGIIEESMSQEEYNDKYDEVALAYAKETGMDLDDAYDELENKDELDDYIKCQYDVDEIIYKLIYESTTMNESFLSPGELKKKLQRVAARWASIKGIKFEEAYNELRKKKSVKDMLDFYSVDEIIDDLSKNKKEIDDELEEEI